MSDDEFDVIDELYLLVHYSELAKALNWEHEKLHKVLLILMDKGWVRCYESPETEMELDSKELSEGLNEYYFLASKEGLLAHNS